MGRARLDSAPCGSKQHSVRKRDIYRTDTLDNSVGKFVVATLRHPEKSFGKALKVQSFVVTPNQVLAEYEKQTGGKWEVTKTPLGEIGALEAKLWAEGHPGATTPTLRRIWAEGGTLYEKNDNEAIGVKPEDLETLEQAVTHALSGGYKADTF